MCRACGFACCEFKGTDGCGCEDCLEQSCWDIDYLTESIIEKEVESWEEQEALDELRIKETNRRG